MGDADLRVWRLAAGQHSLVTHPQLLGAGLTATQIDHRIRCQRLLSVHRGVYRVPGVRPTHESDAMAACLASGGFASHGCAARLFGLRGFQRWTRIDVSVDGRRAPRLPGVVGHCIRGLESTRIGVIPVVMPAEVLLGVAGGAPHLAEGAVNDALVKGLISLPALVRFVNRRSARGRDGIELLRRLVEEQIRAGGPTESWLEDRLVEFLRQRDFPQARRWFWVHLPGKRVRLDVAWPELKINCRGRDRPGAGRATSLGGRLNSGRLDLWSRHGGMRRLVT